MRKILEAHVEARKQPLRLHVPIPRPYLGNARVLHRSADPAAGQTYCISMCRCRFRRMVSCGLASQCNCATSTPDASLRATCFQIHIRTHKIPWCLLVIEPVSPQPVTPLCCEVLRLDTKTKLCGMVTLCNLRSIPLYEWTQARGACIPRNTCSLPPEDFLTGLGAAVPRRCLLLLEQMATLHGN